MNKQTIESVQVGTVLTYLGTEEHPNAATCLIDGKGYEVTHILEGLQAMAYGIDSGLLLVIKDESIDGNWAVHEGNMEHFEILDK